MRNLFVSLLILLPTTVFGADPCFTMTPKAVLDDTCKPVPVTIQFNDCTTGTATDKTEAVARYECNGTPRKLKYWYKNWMLVSDLASGEGWGAKSYTVAKSYVGNPSKKKSESRGVATPATTPAVTTPAAVAASPVAQVVQVAQAPVLTAPETPAAPATAASKVKISGSLDTYYAYNFNLPDPTLVTPAVGVIVPGNPAAQNGYNLFNYYHDQFSLSYAEVVIQQSAEPVGFRVDLGFGPTADNAAGLGVDGSSRNVQQAYLSYKNGSFQIDAGKFVTHMGYEVIEAQDNANCSRSLMFGYSIPFWHAGVRASYAWAPTLSTSVYVLNGWNNYNETNKEKTLGAQVAWTIADGYGLIVNYISGNEVATPGAKVVRSVADVILTAQPLPQLKLALNYDAGSDVSDTTTMKHSSVAAYASWLFDDANTLSLRYEAFDDSDTGYASGTIQKLNSVTATYENKVAEGLKVRAEYRTDTSDKTPFTKGNILNSSATQSVAILSALLSF